MARVIESLFNRSRGNISGRCSMKLLFVARNRRFSIGGLPWRIEYLTFELSPGGGTASGDFNQREFDIPLKFLDALRFEEPLHDGETYTQRRVFRASYPRVRVMIPRFVDA